MRISLGKPFDLQVFALNYYLSNVFPEDPS